MSKEQETEQKERDAYWNVNMAGVKVYSSLEAAEKAARKEQERISKYLQSADGNGTK